jgi:hypothetical protein
LVASAADMKVGIPPSMGNDRDGKSLVIGINHGEGDAVNRDAAFADDVAEQVGRGCDIDVIRVVHFTDAGNRADAIHMALDNMTVKAAIGSETRFEIDFIADSKRPEGRFLQRFVHRIEGNRARVGLNHGETRAIDGDAVAELDAVQNASGADREASRLFAALDGLNMSDFLYDSCKHSALSHLPI